MEEYQLRESLSSYSPRLRHSSFLRTSTVDITTRELVITTRQLVITTITSATSSESTSRRHVYCFGVFMLVISGCLSNVLSTTMTITE